MLRSSKRIAGRSWMTEFINRVFQRVFQDPANTNIPRLRKIIDRASGSHPSMRKVQFQSLDIAQVPCLSVSPSENTDTLIIYLHGGGYVFGSPNGYKALLAQLAINSNATVIAVDYRLAPEHPYPAPQQDCLKVAQTLIAQANQTKTIIAGDSAGGALSITTALSLAKQNTPADACVLISPWVDPIADTGSMQSNLNNDFLTPPFLKLGVESLMGDQPPSDQVRFNNTDLSSLPPTLIQSGTGELFYDQIDQFAQRAADAGVQIEYQPTDAQFHVFQLMSPILKDARNAVSEIGRFINHL